MLAGVFELRGELLVLFVESKWKTNEQKRRLQRLKTQINKVNNDEEWFTEFFSRLNFHS